MEKKQEFMENYQKVMDKYGKLINIGILVGLISTTLVLWLLTHHIGFIIVGAIEVIVVGVVFPLILKLTNRK